jgi:peptide-methionine (R)-S-oxide reductase
MTRGEFLAAVAAGAVFLAAAPYLRGAWGSGSRQAPVPRSAPTGRVRVYSVGEGRYVMADRVVKSEEEWRRLLEPEQFEVARRKGTERAFTGKYWNLHEKGTYRCVCCGNDLFASEAKFESGTGWPSFYAPVAPENVRTVEDRGFFMTRNEVLCSRCDAHLGHVFDDGPPPTGLRYCMNSASLHFVKG